MGEFIDGPKCVRFISRTPAAIIGCLDPWQLLVKLCQHFLRQNRSELSFTIPRCESFALFSLSLLLDIIHNGMPIRLLRTNELRPNQLSSEINPTTRRLPSLRCPEILQQILLLSPITVPRARNSYLDPRPSCGVGLLLAQHYVTSTRLLVPLIHAVISEAIFKRSARQWTYVEQLKIFCWSSYFDV